MINKLQVKAVAFDFGGTLDSPFLHWMDIYIKLYNEEFNLELTRENFRDIYVETERLLDRESIIKPDYTLYDTQLCKAKSHVEGFKNDTFFSSKVVDDMAVRAAQAIANYSSAYVKQAEPTLQALSEKYKLLLVSNYYGNLKTVVTALGIDKYFISLTDSTIEQVRKPDSRLWHLAIERAGLLPQDVVVVGDSMKNDILPSLELGCQVIHGLPLDKKGDDNITSIYSIDELTSLL